MSSLAKFRDNFFIQHEYALATGRTVENLLKRSETLHGNTHFNSFLQQTVSSSSPVDWLDEDHCLNASIHGLKQTAEEIADLELWLGLPYPDILLGLARKRNCTSLEQLFNCQPNEEWGDVTKGDIKPLLAEFHWWCDHLNTLDIHEHYFDSAQSLLAFLNKSIFRQFSRLVDIIEAVTSNWDLDDDVFENIIKGIRKSNKDFIPEWLSSTHAFCHYNVKTKREYQSLYSWFFLSTVAQVYGYKSNLWATKRQWQQMGYGLKQDAQCAPVFHYFTVEQETEGYVSQDENPERIFSHKVSVVFNADEVIGYQGKSYADTKVSGLPVLERRVNELAIHIEHTDGSAAYHYVDDFIMMPHKELFKAKDSTKAYYGTLLHEMVHWTGHETRCKRDFGKNFADSAYAFEELVAEIGSSFLCARFGLTKNVRASSIQYISHWLEQLTDQECTKTLEKAATFSNRASNFIYVPKRDD